MEIKKNSSVAVIVPRRWVNLRGIRLFVREGREIPENADSHIILARVLDSEDPRGLWIELNRGTHEKDPSVKLQSMMVPWNEVLSIIVRQDLSPELWEEARQTGFVSGELSS
jgi:hypothetical protein